MVRGHAADGDMSLRRVPRGRGDTEWKLMGVVYKLTEDVVQFIMERKTADARLSCREITELVAGQYQKSVSKSAVHDVLKEHGVIIPRGRKPFDKAQGEPKAKFQIPLEKKQQLFANVPAGVIPQARIPILSPPKSFIGGPELASALDSRQKHSGMTGEDDKVDRMGEIFIKAASWDLRSYRPISSVSEWKYISTLVSHFRVDLEDGSFFEIDGRFQELGPPQTLLAGLSVGIERAAKDAADHILNNIEPLCIRSTGGHLRADEMRNFVCSCAGMAGKGMTKVSLLGQGGVVLAQFPCSPRQKRRFIIGCQEISEVEYKNINTRIIKHKMDGHLNNMAIISNIIPQTHDSEIVKMYEDRHPPASPILFPAADPGSAQGWARIFFPPGLSNGAFGSILALQGFARDERSVRTITLMVPMAYAHIDALRQAAACVGALDIRDENGRKLFIKTASEK